MKQSGNSSSRTIKILIWSLILIGAFLRFYNLNWGAPFYFHPDERNIVYLILKSSFTNPKTLLNGTFAYGNFPLILTLFLKPLFLPFFQLFKITDPFSQVVIILRFISATSSTLMLFIVYLCGKFFSRKVGLLSLFLATFSTGFIQQAHFGTYDGFVAFSAITVFYFLLRFITSNKILFYYLSILFIALGSAAKINLLILGIFPLVVLLGKMKKEKARFLYVLKHGVLGILFLLCLTGAFSPNYITPEFYNSLSYERSLVTGTTPVFYTQSFFGTIPVIFQLLHIFLLLINPILTIIFLPAFFYLIYLAIKKRVIGYLLLATCFLLLFLPQAVIFAKWTRYMVPTLPFIYLIIAIATSNFFQNFKKVLSIPYFVLSIILVSSVLFGVSYFITAFVAPDTRVAASEFAKRNIPQTAKILSEPYDLGLTTFSFPNITIFNFYDLDNNSSDSSEQSLNTLLQTSDYIILPSQRLLRSRLLNAKDFPKGHAIYSLLINEAAGFQKIYESPCDILCKITYLNDPVFSFEETATVFDHPTVFIFKRID